MKLPAFLSSSYEAVSSASSGLFGARESATTTTTGGRSKRSSTSSGGGQLSKGFLRSWTQRLFLLTGAPTVFFWAVRGRLVCTAADGSRGASRRRSRRRGLVPHHQRRPPPPQPVVEVAHRQLYARRVCRHAVDGAFSGGRSEKAGASEGEGEADRTARVFLCPPPAGHPHHRCVPHSQPRRGHRRLALQVRRPPSRLLERLPDRPLPLTWSRPASIPILVYHIVQRVQAEPAYFAHTTHPNGLACPPAVVHEPQCAAFVGGWAECIGLLTAAPAVIGASQLLFAYWTWTLAAEFGWHAFRLLGGDVRLKTLHGWEQRLSTLLKIDFVRLPCACGPVR